ncbi:MAG TPA: hypothetical protein VHS28_01535 [Chloroflexota bacterium]|nr:hypothetical protein [Chloroflexota bacterium]
MKHRLFTILSALSLLLALLVAGLWIHSLWFRCGFICRHDHWPDNTHCQTVSFALTKVRGGFWCSLAQQQFDLAYTDQHSVRMDLPGMPERFRQLHQAGSHWQWITGPTLSFPGTFAGFRYAQHLISTKGEIDHTRNLFFPAFLPLLLSLLLPAMWMVQACRRHRRIKSGLCLHCGYDLRASTDRCPECGNPISASSVQDNS